MTIALGSEVPDLTFVRADGSLLTLHSLRGRSILLVFVRHLA